MSSELVRKDFELIDNDLCGSSSSQKKRRKQPKSWHPEFDSPEQEVGPPKKKLRAMQKKKKRLGPEKSLLEQYLEQRDADHTAANIKGLRKLSKLRAAEDSSAHREEILKYIHRKHLDREKKEEQKEETSVFTDRDFEKFEEEYDFFKEDF